MIRSYHTNDCVRDDTTSCTTINTKHVPNNIVFVTDYFYALSFVFQISVNASAVASVSMIMVDMPIFANCMILRPRVFTVALSFLRKYYTIPLNAAISRVNRTMLLRKGRFRSLSRVQPGISQRAENTIWTSFFVNSFNFKRHYTTRSSNCSLVSHFFVFWLQQEHDGIPCLSEQPTANTVGLVQVSSSAVEEVVKN